MDSIAIVYWRLSGNKQAKAADIRDIDGIQKGVKTHNLPHEEYWQIAKCFNDNRPFRAALYFVFYLVVLFTACA